MSHILVIEQSLNGLQFGLMLFLLAASLTLVFSIMEDMGGRVHISSPLTGGHNPGTRVSLYLPCASYASTE